MKTNDKETESVFCLSLPPYLGEELDPIHGGILLVEGKLVGLYLQVSKLSKVYLARRFTLTNLK